jgi:hypothetical protein
VGRCARPENIAGTPGALWHARWSVAGRELNVAYLWRGIQRHEKASRYLIHLLFDLGSVTATFAVVDESLDVADAIGEVFDAIFESTRPFRHAQVAEWNMRSFRGAEALPRQVQVRGPFTTVDPYQPPFSLFDT